MAINYFPINPVTHDDSGVCVYVCECVRACVCDRLLEIMLDSAMHEDI